MITIIHCADLHLENGEDREYSLSVLEEILMIAENKKADYLLICGDLFNSFDDAEALRNEFRSYLSILPESCKTLFLPGNHDELRKGNRSLSSLDFGKISPCYTK